MPHDQRGLRLLRIFCLVFTICLPIVATAQTRSILTGRVTAENGGVIVDATVTVASPALPGGPASATTNVEGIWRVADLLPGLYVVAVSAPGYRTVEQREVRVASTGTITVDLTLPIGPVTETVSVVAQRPLLDIRNATTVTTIDRELIAALPVDRRSNFISGLSTYLPGVSNSTSSGANFFGVDYRVDGMTTNDPRAGGTTASPVYSMRWFEEVQFAGLGAQAEYGNALGGTVNLTLRSGSDRLSAQGEFTGTPRTWASDNRGSLSPALQTRFRPREIREQWEGGGNVGGPLGTRKAFFFSGYERTESSTIAAGAIGTAPTESYRDRFMTKVHAVPSNAVRLEGMMVRSERNDAGGSSPTVTAEAVNRTTDELWQFNGRATWTPQTNTLIEGRVSALLVDFLSEPLPPNTRSGPPPHVDLVTNVQSVNANFYNSQWNRRYPVAAAITRVFDRRLAGSHVLKAGVEVERLTNKIESGNPGGLLFQDRNGQPDQVVIWAGDSTDQTATMTAGYVQDTWRLSQTLTLTPGIRINVNRGNVAEKGTVFRTSGIGPRLGMAWAPAGPEALVVRASYGRTYDMYYGRMAEVLAPGQTVRITARVLGPDNYQELNRVTPATNFGIDDSLGHPFVDDYVVGMEQALAPSLSVRAQYAYRKFGNILAFVDENSVYEPVERRDPGPDNVLNTADDGALLTVFNLTNPGQAFFLLTNPDAANRDYHAVSVTADKRLADNWQVLATYTWSRTRGSVGNEIGTVIAQSETTSSTGPFANPNAAINNMTHAPRDYPHEIKIQGLYRLPFWGGATVGANYFFSSGDPWGRRISISGLRQGAQTIRIEPRGTQRVAATSVLDVHLEKSLRLMRTTSSLYIDMYNALNRGTATSVTDTSGSSLGVPAGWSAPRTVRIGFRFSFS